MRDLDASGDPRLRIGSLFSGYGGLDLAVEHVFNAKTVWFSELNEPVAHVFWHHWPEVPNLGDITAIDWSRVCQRRGGFIIHASLTRPERSRQWPRHRFESPVKTGRHSPLPSLRPYEGGGVLTRSRAPFYGHLRPGHLHHRPNNRGRRRALAG